MAGMTSAINVNVPVEVKEEANIIFNNLGLNMSTAINMFLRQCDREQRLVFTPSMTPAPNKELLESLQEIEDYKNGKIKLDSYDDIKSLRKALTDD